MHGVWCQAVVLAFALVAGAAVRAEQPEAACKVIVLELQSRALTDTDRELLPVVGETLAAELGSVSSCEVIAESEIKAMLNYEKTKAICTTEDDSCLAEIGEAYGADRVVAGSLARVGDELVLSARLMNVRRGAVEQRTEQTVPGSRELLLHAAKNAARALVGAAPLDAPPPPPRGNAPLLWGGAIAAGVGAVALVGGGVVTGVAEAQLATRDNTEKDAARTMGRAALVAAGVGAGVGVIGGVLLVWGLE